MFVGVVGPGGGNASRHMEASDNLKAEFAGFGYTPIPGTLNLTVDDNALDMFESWPKLTQRRGWNEPKFAPVWVNGVACHVKRYGDVIEAVASERLRDLLAVVDGDEVTVRFRPVVSGAIMAHRKREAWALQLSQQTGWPIVWDTKGEVWDTARRAWLTFDPYATHHVVVQDDAVLCDGFVNDLPLVLSHAPPSVPVSFCVVDYRMKAQAGPYKAHVDAGAPFFLSFHGLSGVAVACPTRHVRRMVEHGDSLQNNPHDDLKMMSYWRTRKQQIWFTIPSLADHRSEGNPSLLSGHDRFADRGASTFDGRRPSVHSWDGHERSQLMFQKPKTLQVSFVNVRTGKTQTVAADSKAARAFGASNGWRQVGDTPSFTPDDVMVPPKVGRGSARDAWATYANMHGVPFDDDAPRDVIVEACEKAGVA